MIKLLLADDQALVRGALAGPQGLDPGGRHRRGVGHVEGRAVRPEVAELGIEADEVALRGQARAREPEHLVEHGGQRQERGADVN